MNAITGTGATGSTGGTGSKENASDSTTIRDAVSIADRCIHRITECVDIVRTRFDHSNRTTPSPSHGSDNDKGPRRVEALIESIPLLSHFTDASSNASSDLYEEARAKLCQSSHDGEGSLDGAWLMLKPTPPYDTDTTATGTGTGISDRVQLVYEIFLPLLATLGMCYEILDGLPASEPLSIAKALDSSATSTHKSRNRPAPPVGMLSIQNYTNVACLVELITCWTIVPALPPNVLLPLDERVRYQLPKSIRGRLPPRSLQWPAAKQQKSNLVTAVADELQRIVTVVGRLLLLDRFRPMLLPRHLPDLMAAILYRNELLQQNYCSGRQSGIMECLSSELVGGTANCDGFAEPGASNECDATTYTPPSPPTRVDVSWRVKSYQTLLRKGRDTPVWLRAAVSSLLCHVAATDLPVLLSVLVHPAGVGDRGMDPMVAVRQLARAVVPPSHPPTVTDPRYTAYMTGVCQQLVAVVDAARPGANLGLQTHLHCATEGWPQAQQKMSIQTVWAILDLLPKSILESLLYPAILRMNDMVHVDSIAAQDDERVDFSGFHQVIHRLAILLWGRPTTAASVCTVSKVCRLFFKSWSPWLSGVDAAQRNDETSGNQPTLLGAMIRLASVPSVMHSKIKEDAILTVRMFADATMETCFQLNGETSRVLGVDVLAVVLLHSIAPSQWDVTGWSLEASSDHDSDENENAVEKLWLVRGRTGNNLDIESVSVRAKFVVESFFVGGTNSTDQKMTTAKEGTTQLSSLLFQILLVTYFGQNSSASAEDLEVSQRSLTFLASPHFRVVPLVCLPILCEHCPMESLLCLGSDGGIFKIIRIVFDTVIERFARDSSRRLNRDHSMITPGDIDEFRLRLASAASIVSDGGDGQPLLNASDFSFAVAANDEMTLSVASIVLTLLVSILELGKQQRTKWEEKTLQSFAVPLKSMSEMTTCYKSADETTLLLGRISEVASYAAALVASRSSQTNGREALHPPNRNPACDLLVLAESDLSSIEPPLRARSMVLLRKLVHTLEQSDNMTVRVDNEKLTERKEEKIKMLRKILALSFRALTDNESYVYLAAIHTVVAVVESEPTIFVRVVGLAVATGRTTSELCCEELSSEQRIKLTESLTFLIRRRGSFDNEFFFLFETLASGRKPGKTEGSEYHAGLIQEATRDYFIDGSGSLSNSEPRSKSSDDYWENIELRVRTGGPLFKVEEIDIVRAATIILVSELVSAVRTDVIARRCSILVDCCVYTLRLESSRSIRRAGATLARELYAALVRESDDLYKGVQEQKDSNIPLSVAMLDGREDILHAVLERVVSANDIEDGGHEERCYDPATVARCREAINLRLEAVSGGILSAGKIVLESNSIENHGVARLLKRSIGSNLPPRIVRFEELI